MTRIAVRTTRPVLLLVMIGLQAVLFVLVAGYALYKGFLWAVRKYNQYTLSAYLEA